MQGLIFYSTRLELKNIIKDICNDLNLSDFVFSKDQLEIVKALSSRPRNFFIIDYQDNFKDLDRLLDKIRKANNIETRPVLLVAKELTQEVTAFCNEFGITSVHLGQLSKKSLLEKLNEIKKEEDYDAPVRDVLVQVGQARKDENIGEAISILKDLLTKIPDHDRVKTELAELYISQGDWGKAKELLVTLDQTDAPYVRGLHLLAKCFMKEKNYSEATATYQKAKILNPYNVERLIELGRVLFSQGEIEEAKQNFKEARSHDPKNRQAITGEGQCKLMEGDLNEALKLLRQVSSEKELASIFNSTAVIAVRNGKFEQGLDLYDQALKSLKTADNLTQAKLIFNKGIGYRRWAKDEDALKCFDHALQLDKNFDKAKLNYNFVAKKLNIIKNAVTSVQPSQEKSSISADIDDILEAVPIDGEEKSQVYAEAANFDLNISEDDGEEDFDDEALGIV